MKPYHFARSHRVAVCPAIADITQPTLAEVVAGVDVSGDVVLTGLNLTRTTESVGAGLWRDRFQGTRPGRASMGSQSLVGRRSRPGSLEQLWDLAVFGSHHFLVVRRGVPPAVAWSPGQSLETFDFRFGQRSTIGSQDGAVVYEVPVFVTAQFDDAVLDGGQLTIDDEAGNPIEDETGDDLLAEASP